MKNERRKILRKVIDQLNEAKETVYTMKDIEETAHDNLPESFQDGDVACKMEEAIEEMDEAIDLIDDAISHIEAAVL